MSTRPNDRERTLAEQEPLPVLNVFECQWCHGPVDRHAHLFQCRECKAVGDLVTGIMVESYEAIKKRSKIFQVRLVVDGIVLGSNEVVEAKIKELVTEWFNGLVDEGDSPIRFDDQAVTVEVHEVKK